MRPCRRELGQRCQRRAVLLELEQRRLEREREHRRLT